MARTPLGSQLPDFPWDTIADVRKHAASHEDGLIDLSVGGPVDPAGAQGQPASEAAAQHQPVLVDRAQRGVQARTAGLGQAPGCVASG